MNETTAQSITRDDVRAIVGEEIGKLGGLLATTSGFTGSTGQGLKFDDGANEVPDRVPEYGRLVSSIFIESFFEAVKHGATDGVALRKVEIVKLSGHETSPSVDDAGAHSVGDGLGAGDASATPATEVTDPHISARYDAPLNAIAMSVGGTDDLYFDRDATFLLVDELRAALHDQAKSGGLA